MINVQENILINERLKKAYEDATPEMLKIWSEIYNQKPPFRMNEFGIIDVEKYDTDNGILFIGRETNGWDDKDYEEGYLFRDRMCDISRNGLNARGHITRHPNMWYNIGRWTMLLSEENRTLTQIADAKSEAISEIGKIAFTNVNKVRGGNVSGDEYFRFAVTDVAKNLLRTEIEIIKPKIIVCCGTARPIFPLPDDFNGEFYVMPHPAARKRKIDMLVDLNKQRRKNKTSKTF